MFYVWQEIAHSGQHCWANYTVHRNYVRSAITAALTDHIKHRHLTIMYVCVCMLAYVCVCVCLHVCVSACVHVCMHMYLDMCTYVYASVFVWDN